MAAAAGDGKDQLCDADVKAFASDVVQSLYGTVRCKLKEMLDAEYSKRMTAASGGDPPEEPFPIDDLLKQADDDVRKHVIPVVADHIVWLMKV